MTRAPRVIPGQARTCPLCKATILESASVCPACRHHLRFDSHAGPREWTSSFPLQVEGTIRHSVDGAPWEYSILLAVRNEKGEEIARQVLGVGALKSAEERTFTLSVEVLTPVVGGAEARQPK
jgi:hypothetical protein